MPAPVPEKPSASAEREPRYLPKRRVVLPRYRKKIIEFLTEKLSDKENALSFLMSLPCAKGNMPSACPVRVFTFEGTKVVIKSTLGLEKHGYKPNWVKGDILRHIKTFRGPRAPQTYRLRLPQLYAQVGRFLIMEAVENRTSEMLKDSAVSPLVVTAFKELKDNLKEIAAESPMKRPLQAHHFMCAGIKGGKVLFYAPYDFEEI